MKLPDKNKIKSFFNFEITKTAAQRLNITANICLITLSILTGVILIQNYFPIPSSANSQSPRGITSQNTESSEKASLAIQKARVQPTLGKKLDMLDLDFSKSQKTLILVLRQGCSYCTESASFYKHLIEKVKNKNIKIVAILPTSIEESKAYLSSLGIADLEIKQAALKDLQIPGTPTLILANNHGEITNFWIGKLSADREKEVINLL